MKKLFTALVIVTLCISLVGCGAVKIDEAGEVEKKPVSHTLTKKIYDEYFSDSVYTVEFESLSTEAESEVLTDILLMKNKEDMYYEFEVNGLTEGALIKDKYMYMKFEESKTCYKMPLGDAELDGAKETYSIFDDIGGYNEPIKNGKEEINGEELQFETYMSGQTEMTYYFSKDELKIIKADADTVTIKNISNDIEAENFEISSDYYVVDYDSSDLGV